MLSSKNWDMDRSMRCQTELLAIGCGNRTDRFHRCADDANGRISAPKNRLLLQLAFDNTASQAARQDTWQAVRSD